MSAEGGTLNDGTSVAPPVLGKEALQAMVDTLTEITTIPKLQSVILAGELWVSLAPHVAALVAQERERCAQVVLDWAGNYPATVFPTDSDSRDAVSGTALREVLPRVAERLRDGL